MHSIRHLVLSGGGLKGIAFLGTLECLQRRDGLDFSKIQTFAGSSAGSILSVLLLCGYSVAEIFKIVHDIQIKDLIDIDFSKLTTLYGVDSGYKLMKILRDLFTQKHIDPDITLKELYELTGKRLIVTVSCLGKGVRYFDYTNEPELSVLLAIRMSIGIPLLLTAVKYKDDYYVDGGVLDNIPLKSLAEYPVHTVLTIRTTSFVGNEKVEINNFEDYIWNLGSTIFSEIELLRSDDYNEHHDNALVVPISEHPSIDITNVEKTELFKTGYLAGKEYLNSNQYFQLRIKSLPWNVSHIIWKCVHQSQFELTLKQVREKISQH